MSKLPLFVFKDTLELLTDFGSVTIYSCFGVSIGFGFSIGFGVSIGFSIGFGVSKTISLCVVTTGEESSDWSVDDTAVPRINFECFPSTSTFSNLTDSADFVSCCFVVATDDICCFCCTFCSTTFFSSTTCFCSTTFFSSTTFFCSTTCFCSTLTFCTSTLVDDFDSICCCCC